MSIGYVRPDPSDPRFLLVTRPHMDAVMSAARHREVWAAIDAAVAQNRATLTSDMRRMCGEILSLATAGLGGRDASEAQGYIDHANAWIAALDAGHVCWFPAPEPHGGARQWKQGQTADPVPVDGVRKARQMAQHLRGPAPAEAPPALRPAAPKWGQSHDW